MSTEHNTALVRRFYEEVWNLGNVDVAMEIFTDDYVRHDLRSTRAPAGGRGMAKIATDFRAAFPDLTMQIDLLIAEGDLVAARWTTSGTFSGPWADVEPTGRRASFSGVNIFGSATGGSSSSGTIATTWGSWSRLAHRSSQEAPGTRTGPRPTPERSSNVHPFVESSRCEISLSAVGSAR